MSTVTFYMENDAGRNFLSLLKFDHLVLLSSFVWKRALEEKQKIPKADQYGWSMIDGTYKVHLINT